MSAGEYEFGTKREVWAALAAPVDPTAIAWRQDGKAIARDGKYFARFVCYIEANTVRERLDSVVPGEWDLTLDLLPVGSVADRNGAVDADTQCAFKARLHVLGVIREDVGHGKDYKQAATDAFKRAAVRFGIGNELYSYEQNWVEVDGDGKYAKPVEDPAVAYARRHGQTPPSARERVAQANPTMQGTTNAPSKTHGTPPSTTRSTDAGDAGASTATATVDVDNIACPKCGGRMWDNRTTKRNPKAPDYKCRDRNCDGAIWPPKTGTRGNAMDAADVVERKPSRRAAAPTTTDEEIPF